MINQSYIRIYRCVSFATLVFAIATSPNLVYGAGQQAVERPIDTRPTSPGSEATGLTQGPNYRIGVGDLIEVRVDKAQELTGTYRVTDKGTFQMYFLGTVVAQNKSLEELSVIIADGLRGRYLKSPHVVVEVKQRYRPKVFVQGAVRNPGAYELEGKVSLLKLISLCGGLADNHGSSAFIFREAHASGSSSTEQNTNESTGNKSALSLNAEAPPDYEFTPVSIAGLLRGNLSENVVIEPFDIVNIPPADLFFVAGEVRAPGSFPVEAWDYIETGDFASSRHYDAGCNESGDDLPRGSINRPTDRYED